MRSPLLRAAGTGSFIELRGVTYQCSPLRLRHFAEAKAFLASLAPDTVKELTDDLETFNKFPPEVQKALALKALELREQRRAMTSAEAAHWINSEEGVLFLFWCMVRNHHKELATLQAVLDRFTPGDKDNELSIPECDKIRAKIDEITLGADVPAPDKKKAATAKRLKKAPRRKMKH